MSASLSRRLSAFFGSTSDQGQKAAKYAVLTPGHAGFRTAQNAPRVVIASPIQNAPCFAVCALVCDFSPKAECVPAFAHEGKRGPFVSEVERCNEKRLGDKIYGGSFPTFAHPLIVRIRREPGNVCI